MGRVQAETRPTNAIAAPGWLRRFNWFLAVRRVLIVLCLADVAEAEVQLSLFAKTGNGANRVAASPVLVTLLLCAAIGAAVLLRWESVAAGVIATWRALLYLPASLRKAPYSVRASIARRFAQRNDTPALFVRWAMTMHAATWPQWAGITLTWVGLLSALIASGLVSAPFEVLAAQWFWLGGIGLLLVAALVWPSARPSPLSQLRWRLAVDRNKREQPRWHALWNAWGDWLLLVPLLGVALALRLPNLASVPYVVHGDEASCGLEALRWLHGEIHTLFATGWYGLPVAGYGIPALVMRFAGANLFGLRLSSVIVGTLSLALLYLLAREFASRRVAFVATALMTVAHLHIQFSRSGIHYIHALFAVELTLWLLVRALRTRSAVAAVLAAVAMSLSVQVYFSARIVFVIVPLFIVGLLLVNRRLLFGRGPTLGWLAAGLVAAVGPLAVYFQTSSHALNSRTNEVLILNLTPWMRSHLTDQFGTADLPTVLLRQLAAVPLIPAGIADQSTQYGPHYSLLDIAVATLVTIGFFYALLRLRQPAYLLLTIWITGTVVLGGMLTIDMPDWQRLLVMLPALFLLAALLLEDMLQRVERGIGWLSGRLPTLRLPRPAPMLAATALALVLVGLSASWNIQRYFVDFPHQTNHDPWWTTYSDIGRYLGTLPAGTHFILYSDNSLIADYATLRYLGPGTTGVRVESIEKLMQALEDSTGPTVTIVTLSRVGEMEKALAVGTVLPPGSFIPYVTANHATTFYLFTPSGQSPGSVADTR